MSQDKETGLKSWLSGPRRAQPERAGPEPQPALDNRRVAVLPFANMSPDPNDEYFADGLTEELISALAKLPSLHVISRTSVMQYKKQSKPISDIRRELGVGTLLEGSVRKAGNRVRIAVQLIDANTDNHLWAENYDRNLDDIFAVQTDVASKVSTSLKAGVFGGLSETRDIEAYILYIRAMQLSHEDSESSLAKAVGLLQDVIARDRSLVRARVGLALLWLRIGNYGYEDFTAVERGLNEAQRAVDLQPSSAEAHAAKAQALQYLDRFDEARQEAEMALRLNPSASEAWFTLGFVYSTRGSLDKGLEYFRKAMELDPVAVYKARRLTPILGILGKVDEARALLAKLEPHYSQNPALYIAQADYYLVVRDFENAEKSISRGLSINPDEPLLLIDQGLTHALTGKRTEAEAVLRQLQKNKSESVRDYSQIFIHTALGNLDEAFKALAKGSESHVWPFLIKTLPLFEELRKDPRFREFCLKMKIHIES